MIGFDIGTTQSKVAYVDPSGKPTAVTNAQNEQQVASAVYVPESGDVLVGTEAIEQGYIDPRRCLTNFKLKLGSTENLLSNGQIFTPTEATEQLVKTLKENTERQLGIEVSEAVITCPANFRDDSKQALLESFERNGIKVLKLVPEPTAAGLAYACDKAGHGMNIAVYDFGGGTFDVSILRVDSSQITVLSTEGVPKLGGNDLNECLRQRVQDAFRAKF